MNSTLIPNEKIIYVDNIIQDFLQIKKIKLENLEHQENDQFRIKQFFL